MNYRVPREISNQEPMLKAKPQLFAGRSNQTVGNK